ncbi:MAG UNVERIFIED_CONTAM: WhiB family transcriptional regulator [Anaerolineae bacterium]|jgi:hypothetical protein
MTVLFSELLVPGWAEGPTAKIGLGDVTWAYEDAPVISYADYTTNSTAETANKSYQTKVAYKRADNPFAPDTKQVPKISSLPCHTSDPELFFSEIASVIAQAKALCGSCPVKAKCYKEPFLGVNLSGYGEESCLMKVESLKANEAQDVLPRWHKLAKFKKLITTVN